MARSVASVASVGRSVRRVAHTHTHTHAHETLANKHSHQRQHAQQSGRFLVGAFRFAPRTPIGRQKKIRALQLQTLTSIAQHLEKQLAAVQPNRVAHEFFDNHDRDDNDDDDDDDDDDETGGRLASSANGSAPATTTSAADAEREVSAQRAGWSACARV